MDRTEKINQNINEWAEGHRHWLATAIRECGHHAMYFNKSRGFCVCCRAESGFVSLEVAIELAFPEEQKTDDELLAEVRAPGSQVGRFGFFGGGPVTQPQSAYLRYLLRQHNGREVWVTPPASEARHLATHLLAQADYADKMNKES